MKLHWIIEVFAIWVALAAALSLYIGPLMADEAPPSPGPRLATPADPNSV
jgi:hypothetical protein